MERNGTISALVDNVERVIIGKRPVIELALTGMLARGHILLEDVPGVGKTMLARALAISLGGRFTRIQFTPDLLPSDVVGVSVWDGKAEEFRFKPGPIFANLVLADEINRTSPRTQSALLEVMSDFQASLDGVTHPAPKPFFVLATQNPVEYAGTYPLPESQLDRFFLRIAPGYPAREDEFRMLGALSRHHPIESLEPVTTPEQIAGLQEQVLEIKVSDPISHYILEIVERTRNHPQIMLGASPRASLALYRGAQALALLRGRDYALPDDVKELARPLLAHRILEKNPVPGQDPGGEIVSEIVDTLEVPL